MSGTETVTLTLKFTTYISGLEFVCVVLRVYKEFYLDLPFVEDPNRRRTGVPKSKDTGRLGKGPRGL